ncbi:ankyrin [Punctularia strigosozonata HHB-11173 SS5]|uniref:Ankyrin n=1 Tax=Punctularia strigosozonata (strain HHB-11173) TaxID=741275 RepID=R7S4R7_PUNST|nr:ankyrin [Punctularia strigosozonata HHB-11173 SS5]EIN04807.1 ankyrin [Punctularia strigosozonata HHB-11173 SS5]
MAIATNEKNIWVAAGDGDLVRVRVTVSPNAPDANTYTPMHAAASYGHTDVLAYLISRGGDVNVTDEDGDTPIYTVENLETARFLVDHGAHVSRTNREGVSPADHVREDFPEIADYLERVVASAGAIGSDDGGPLPAPPPAPLPSQHSQNVRSEALTSTLIAEAQEIMARAEREGTDPDAELREAVSRTVLQGMVDGYRLGSDAGEDRRAPPEEAEAKRPRPDQRGS